MLDALPWTIAVALGFALLLACVFELANGFHDTANAVATVIYTRTLKPRAAVLWSAVCNFIGVFAGGIGVAMSIVYLLPTELLVSQGTWLGLAMVIAILISAITWNIGTWYYGIPASSSHTLIGAILGVGLANSLLPGHAFGSGVNWVKAREILMSLLISPVLGFWLGAMGLAAIKVSGRGKGLFHIPKGHDRPPRGVRAVLLATCSGVSFAHGSNDGQKGVGLVLLILIAAMPATFSLRPSVTAQDLRDARVSMQQISERLARLPETAKVRVVRDLDSAKRLLDSHAEITAFSGAERGELRRALVTLASDLRGLEPYRTPQGEALLKKDLKPLRRLIEFAPLWVIAMIAIALGIGTSIGWKRVVVTVGERIGKAHLNYAQGAVAETVAMAMIGFAAVVGMPVSTTHVLSSAVTGTMAAHKSGVQFDTVRKILLAWVLTLPVSIVLSGSIFLLLRAALV